MRRLSLPRIGTVLLFCAALCGPAFAQMQACEAWRAELASLRGQRGGDPRATDMARRTGLQLNQMIGQYRAMGCERGGFGIFGQAPPPQCGALGAQIGQVQARFQALQQQAEGGGVEQRRAQLAALIQNNCRAQPQQRGFFETIFGLEPRRGEIDSTLPELDPEEQQPEGPAQPRMGGGYAVCVRGCDGFFFPLANSPGGREGADEMCQSLCPGTETSAFYMTNGGNIENAVSRSGQPYTSLPNAGKFQRSFDAACTCRAPGQSWSQALQHAEELLDKRKGDVIISEQRAAELSRPRTDSKARNAKAQAAAPPQAPAPVPDEAPMPSENAPTAGTESAGMGPQVIEGEKTLDQRDGLKRESRGANGERRVVRIVAPNLAPNLGAAAKPQQP